jgi:pyruvate/2-oxoglutarate dehydrogenase complex dihydrolipoamide acyltransferase (E2) component
MGIAVALGDEGLIVPVIREVENLSLLGIARALNAIGDRARAKRLTIEDTKGGTFTITSPGQMGALMGTPIINQPQSAILHFGAVEKRPAVVEGPDGEDVLAIRSKACLTLGIDHRLIDGWVADSFMAAVRDRLERGDFQVA